MFFIIVTSCRFQSTTFAIGAILHLSAEGDSLKWLLRLSKYSNRGSRWKQTLDHRTSQRKKTPLHQALPNLSNQPDANKPKPPGQSLNSHAKGKSNLTSMGYQIKLMRSYSSMPQVQQWSGIWLQKDNHTLQESVRKDNHTPQESVLEG
ncbi:hypothetical protein PSTT_02160 [Puccinia striiformis]|uniref:Uncharacterized protein n=1 Tax=Puccinia striiformis TaxID=27350 RepID=A0A2S4W123_9BASI|nr:hypothetical protein PSTT_02160 [Puccinia striiformis]